MRLLPKSVDWTAYAWLVYLVPFLAWPFFAEESTALEKGVTLAATAVFLGLYFRGYWLGGRALYPTIAAITALGVAFTPTNRGAMVFFIYAGSFAAFAGGTAVAVRLIIAIELVLLAEIWILGIHLLSASWAIVFTALVGALNIHSCRQREANSRLRLAQDEIERLAKVAERERIARDLHDVLGHTLSLIILKSELASKLADRDPQRARDEIRDVERISRDALSAVRHAVGGYRAGWKQELESAMEMLRTAEIEVSAERVTPPPLTPAQEAILSLSLREAVTNVVRHSEADRCEIHLETTAERVTLTVADDGRGGTAADGFGLSGMRERLASIGGTMEREGSRGTRLTVTIPRRNVVALERPA